MLRRFLERDFRSPSKINLILGAIYTLKNVMMERAYATCLEMLQQRGYEILDQEDNRIMALKPCGEQIAVFLIEMPKFNVKCMGEYISIMNELEVRHAIIVYKDGVTPATKKTIEQSEEMRIELFAEEDLQYNITKHRLQPVFELLDEEQSAEFTKNFGTKFGVMRSADPIVRFYDYQKGAVVRIIRKTGYISYRIVK